MFRSDNFSSIRKAVKLMGISWEACQPGVHHSNAIIERCNQELLNDCRVALFQAGLPACFWPYGSPYAAHIHNITLDPEDGKSPCISDITDISKAKAFLLGVEYGFSLLPPSIPIPRLLPSGHTAFSLDIGFNPGVVERRIPCG